MEGVLVRRSEGGRAAACCRLTGCRAPAAERGERSPAFAPPACKLSRPPRPLALLPLLEIWARGDARGEGTSQGSLTRMLHGTSVLRGRSGSQFVLGQPLLRQSTARPVDSLPAASPGSFSLQCLHRRSILDSSWEVGSLAMVRTCTRAPFASESESPAALLRVFSLGATSTNRSCPAFLLG
jgi:hypothetical protein